MPKDSLDKLMEAIAEAEKEYGDNHRYRHTFSALRNARYSFSKVRSNAEYDSPGQQAARELGAKEKPPPREDHGQPSTFEEAGEKAAAQLAGSGAEPT